MEFVAVPVCVVRLFGAAQDLDMVSEIREIHVLGETVSDIDAETVGAQADQQGISSYSPCFFSEFHPARERPCFFEPATGERTQLSLFEGGGQRQAARHIRARHGGKE